MWLGQTDRQTDRRADGHSRDVRATHFAYAITLLILPFEFRYYILYLVTGNNLIPLGLFPSPIDLFCTYHVIFLCTFTNHHLLLPQCFASGLKPNSTNPSHCIYTLPPSRLPTRTFTVQFLLSISGFVHLFLVSFLLLARLHIV